MISLESCKKSEELIKELELNDNNKIKISELFPETFFNAFKVFCSDNNINTLFDLEHYNIDLLLNNSKGVGEAKKAKIKKRIYDYNINGGNLLANKTNVNLSNKLLIEEIFKESSYKLFRDSCIRNNIITVEDLLDFGVDLILDNIKGIGYKRKEQIKTKLEEIKDVYQEKKEYIITNVNIKSKINNVFYEIVFKDFRAFCASEGLETLEDLQDFYLYEKFLNYEKLSSTKLIRVFDKLKQLNINKTLNEYGNIFKIHSDFSVIKTYVLFDKNNCNKLYYNFFKRFEYLEELNKVSLKELKEKQWNLSQIKKLFNYVKNLRYPLKKFLQETYYDATKEEFYPILVERLKNKTLEEIGNQLEFKTKKYVTRERVRQLEYKGVKFFLRIIDVVSSILERKGEKQDYPILRINVLEDIFDSLELAKIVQYCIKNKRKDAEYAFLWTYLTSIEQVVISSQANKINYFLKQIENKLPEMFLIETTYSQIEKILDRNNMGYIIKKDFIKYFINSGYQIFGKFLAKRKPNKIQMTEFIIKNFYKDGFKDKLDGETYNIKEIDNVVDKVKEYFDADIKFGDYQRNVIKYMEDADNIFRWEDSKFIHIDNLNISEEELDYLMELLTLEIKDALEGSSNISTKYIYDKHSDELQNTYGIPDYKSLHSLLKNRLSNTFYITPKYMISLLDAKDITKSDQLLELVNQNNGIISVSDAYEKLKWTQALISSMVNSNENLIFVENYKKIENINHYNLDNDFKEKFKNIVEQSFIDDYTNGDIIYSKNVSFFNNKSIVDGDMVYQIARCFFSKDYLFKRVHILKNKAIKSFTVKTLIQRVVYNKIIENKSEIIDFKNIYEILVNKYKFKQSVIYMEINRHIPKVLFPLSTNKLISLNRNTISKNTLENIKQKIEQKIQSNKDYIYVNKLNFKNWTKITFEKNNKTLSFELNTASLSALIKNYFNHNYRVIESLKSSRESKTTFIVAKNSVYKNINQMLLNRVKTPEELKQEKDEKIKHLKGKIITINNKITKEKQFNKQVELNMQKQLLQNQLKELVG